MSSNYHNKGQEDAAKGKNNPPHSINNVDRMVYDKHTIDKMERHNKQYEKGQDNAKKNK